MDWGGEERGGAAHEAAGVGGVGVGADHHEAREGVVLEDDLRSGGTGWKARRGVRQEGGGCELWRRGVCPTGIRAQGRAGWRRTRRFRRQGACGVGWAGERRAKKRGQGAFGRGALGGRVTVRATALAWWMIPLPGFQKPMPNLAPEEARKSYTWGQGPERAIQ